MKTFSYGKSKRVDIWIKFKNEFIVRLSHVIFYDNNKKTKGHLKDGREVFKVKNGRWIHIIE